MNMGEEVCKECVAICAECRHQYGKTEVSDKANCRVYGRSEMNCVTGMNEYVPAKCIDHNKYGSCGKFERDEVRTIRRKFVSALNDEWRSYCSQGGGHSDNAYYEILSALKDYFDGHINSLKPLCRNPSKRGDRCW